MLHAQAMGRRKIAVLSDIQQSVTPERELYSRIAEAVDRAGVDRLIGVGESISRNAALFGCEAAFYPTTDDLLAELQNEDWSEAAILVKGSRNSRLERLCHRLERRCHDGLGGRSESHALQPRLFPPLPSAPPTRSWPWSRPAVTARAMPKWLRCSNTRGAAYLAVAFADEGVVLREKGITMPIVVLNADEDSFEQMIRFDLEPEIYSFRSLDAFSRAADRAGRKHYPIHIKLDTGMHRLGFVEEQIDPLAERLAKMHNLKAATVFSHLNCSDTPSEDEYTRRQIALYDAMSSRLCEQLPYRPIRHTANSAAIERFPEAAFDMCRLGLGLYGFGYRHNDALTPVSTLRTRIVQIKHLPAGDTVGYGRAGVLDRDTVTATIPIGLRRRARPSSGLRTLVDARGRAACADRRTRLHGQLHDRHNRYRRCRGGRQRNGLLGRSGQHARRYGRRTRHDTPTR